MTAYSPSNMIAADVLIAAVVAFVIAINVWWRRHRAKETPLQKRVEDRKIKEDIETW